jgi:hypothetical protein
MTIGACSRCSGVWLDSGELQPILKARDIDFPPALVEKTLKEAHAGIPKAEVDALLACPMCSQPMHALNYDYSSGVIINVCPGGQGLWFDKDELAEVQIFMEHWDEQEAKHHSEWASMAMKARTDEERVIRAQNLATRKNLGPIGQVLDAVFQKFEDLIRKD